MTTDLVKLQQACALIEGRQSYQVAVVKDGKLVPTGQTALKYSAVKYAASLFKGPFTFADIGCWHGLIGFTLQAEFENVTRGVYVNLCKEQIETCNQLVQLLEMPNAQVIHANAKDVAESFDLTLYLSFVNQAVIWMSVDEMATMIAKQTRKYAVVDIPSMFHDIRCEEGLKDRRQALDRMLSALLKYFDVIKCYSFQYVDRVMRYCYVLKKLSNEVLL